MSNKNERRRVVAMIRVSTPGQAKMSKQDRERAIKDGLERQNRDIRFTCSQHSLELVATIPLKGISGPDVRLSAEFRELKSWLAKKHISGLVIPSVDRLTRSTEFRNLAALMEPFEELMGGRSTKRLWTRKEELDVSLPADRDKIWQQLRYAEEERAMIRYRTFEAKEELRASPTAKVDKLPKGVGFKRHNEDENVGWFFYSDWAFNDLRPAIYRIIRGDATLRTVAEDLGMTQTGMRHLLESRWWIGEKARLKTEEVQGEKWDVERNRRRRGKAVPHPNPIIKKVDMKTADGNQDVAPLLTADQWDALQDILKRNHDTWTQRKTRVNEFLGAGLLYCKCSERLQHKKDPRPNKRPYYVCRLKYHGKGHMDAEWFKAVELDNEIALQATLHLTDETVVEAKIKESLNAESTEQKRRALDRAEKTTADLQKQMKNAEELVLKLGLISDREQRIRELEADLADAKHRARIAREDLSASLSDVEVRALARHIKNAFAGFATMDRPLQKDLLARYVERIDVRLDEIAGYVVTFGVRVGMPVVQFQRDAYPERENPKNSQPKRILKIAADWVRDRHGNSVVTKSSTGS